MLLLSTSNGLKTTKLQMLDIKPLRTSLINNTNIMKKTTPLSLILMAGAIRSQLTTAVYSCCSDSESDPHVTDSVDKLINL